MLKNALSISASILIFFSSTPCYAQWRDHGGSGWFGPGMMGWGWWGMGWILMIVFWALVIIALIFLIRWLARQNLPRAQRDAGRDSALEILRQRYAKGEIDKEEFDQKKRDLM